MKLNGTRNQTIVFSSDKVQKKSKPVKFLGVENVLRVHMNLPKYTGSSDMHNYNTRRANTLRSDYSRIEITKRNKINPQLYNLAKKYFINVNIDLLSKFRFKHLIRSLLLDHCFYSTQEFVDFISDNGNSN
nr:unnamed protein product [Callosobruchus analis]